MQLTLVKFWGRHFNFDNLLCVRLVVEAIPKQVAKVAQRTLEGICHSLFLTLCKASSIINIGCEREETRLVEGCTFAL